MINKRFIPHRFAVEDEEEIVHYYEQTSSEQVALNEVEFNSFRKLLFYRPVCFC